jgi:SWI/SNF-related matrix-associated actin-dependent regulator of chromatin subfamily A3
VSLKRWSFLTLVLTFHDVLSELLDGWLQDDNTKCLVFSTFTSLLDLCSKAMSHRGISHEMYTGSMRTSDREAAIQNFKRPGRNAPRVCLISTKAGGVGLNLCEANK